MDIFLTFAAIGGWVAALVLSWLWMDTKDELTRTEANETRLVQEAWAAQAAFEELWEKSVRRWNEVNAVLEKWAEEDELVDEEDVE